MARSRVNELSAIKDIITFHLNTRKIGQYYIYLFGPPQESKLDHGDWIDLLIVTATELSPGETFSIARDLRLRLFDFEYAFEILIKNNMSYMEERRIPGALMNVIYPEVRLL